MASESFAVEVPMSVERAFSLVIDLLNSPKWDHGIRDPHLISGTPGQIGASYELTVTGFDGAATTATYQLTEVDSPNSFTMVGTNADFRADDTVRFESTPNGCRICYDASLVLVGDNPPITDAKLDAVFAKVAEVPKRGLVDFLSG